MWEPYHATVPRARIRRPLPTYFVRNNMVGCVDRRQARPTKWRLKGVACKTNLSFVWISTRMLRFRDLIIIVVTMDRQNRFQDRFWWSGWPSRECWPFWATITILRQASDVRWGSVRLKLFSTYQSICYGLATIMHLSTCAPVSPSRSK